MSSRFLVIYWNSYEVWTDVIRAATRDEADESSERNDAASLLLNEDEAYDLERDISKFLNQE